MEMLELAAELKWCRERIAALEAERDQLRKELAEYKRQIADLTTPNLLWDFYDPENTATDCLHDAVIQEIEMRGELKVGDELAFLAAHKLPNIVVRITSHDEDGEVTYEEIDAALAAEGEAK